MAKKLDTYARCPYYRRDEVKGIRCEGVEKATALHLNFVGDRALLRYKNRYCRSRWCRCRIARMLSGVYGFDADGVK